METIKKSLVSRNLGCMDYKLITVIKDRKNEKSSSHPNKMMIEKKYKIISLISKPAAKKKLITITL